MLGKKKMRLERLESRISPLKDHDPELEAFIEAFIKHDPEGRELVKAKYRAELGRVIDSSNGVPIREEPDQKEIERLGQLLDERILYFAECYFSGEYKDEGV